MHGALPKKPNILDIEVKTRKSEIGARIVYLVIETVGERAAAGRDEHHVGVNDLGRAAGRHRLDRHLDDRAARVGLGHLLRKAELEALLFEDLLEELGGLGVQRRHNAVAELDDGHLGAEAAPHRAHLEADDAGADDDHLLGHGGQRERAGRRDDALLVNGHAGNAHDLGAGGDQNVLAPDGLLRAVVAVDLDLVGRRKLAPALDIVDLVLLEQALDAARQLPHVLVLVGEHLAQVEADAGRVDAKLAHVVLGLVVEVRRVQQRLGRDAADVEAGAAERAALLDARDLHAHLAGLDGRDVAAGAATDDNEVLLVGCRGKSRDRGE